MKRSPFFGVKTLAVEDDVLNFQYSNLPVEYFTSLDIKTIYADLKLITRVGSEHVIVAFAELSEGLTIQIVEEKDEPGIFLRVAGVLYSHGIDILKAAIFTGKKDTMVIDHFVVHPQTDRKLLDRVCGDIKTALIHKTYFQPELRKADKTGLCVSCFQSGAEGALKIEAKNQTGFLYRVAKVLADLNLSLIDADIKTQEDNIIDTFRILTPERKMPTLDKLKELREAVLKTFE